MTTQLITVISGGQTGVDHAGLEAAHQLGIETDGWMPKGFRRLDGKGIEIAKKYGLKETDSPSYAHRTALNVKCADITLVVAARWASPGELCTMKAIKRFSKPCILVPLIKGNFKSYHCPFTAGHIAYMVAQLPHKMINVAGNSEKTCPGIYEEAYSILKATFETLRLNDLRKLF